MPVKAVALEIILIVDKVENHIAYMSLEHTAILSAPCHRDRQTRYELHVVAQLLRNILIEWQNNPAADEAQAKRLRKGTRYLRESSR
jgi:hypothetical protein